MSFINIPIETGKELSAERNCNAAIIRAVETYLDSGSPDVELPGPKVPRVQVPFKLPRSLSRRVQNVALSKDTSEGIIVIKAILRQYS